MSKKRVLHLNNPLKWNLDVYDDDTPGFRKLRVAFLGLALGFLVLGVVASFVTGSSYPFRAAGTASFVFAFLCDRLKPGYKEFWKAMGYALFFFVGGFLLRSMAEAILIMGFWFLLLLSRWRGIAMAC